ncbi:MAG: AMP-binding protein [Opitutales bacterium]
MASHDADQFPGTLAMLPGASGGGPAILEYDGKQLERFSFDDLLKPVRRLAAGLRMAEDGGESGGGPIVLFAPPSFRAIAAALGILRAGRVVVPLDTQMADDDLKGVFENCGAELVITTGRLGRRLAGLKGLERELRQYALDEDDELDSWETLWGEEGDDGAEPDPDDTAVLFYTSGTTGPPKGVPLSHRNLRVQLEAVLRSGLIGRDERVLLPLPLHHVYPFVIGVLAPMAIGIPVVLPGGLTGSALSRALREAEPTVAIGVPRLYRALFSGIRERVGKLPGGDAVFERLLRFAGFCGRRGIPVGRWLFRPLRRRVGPKLRLLASGGSPLDPELAERLEAFGWSVAVGYGLTETSPLLTLKMPGEGPYGSVGRAIEEVELKLDPDALDDTESEGEDGRGKSDTDGGIGELLAKGPNVFAGYHRMEEATNKCFDADGFFRTGDLARIEDGYVYIEGRLSTRIALQGGENVDPSDLEERYSEAEGVEEIGVLEDDGKLAALVVPKDDWLREADREELSRRIKRSLKERGEGLPSYQRFATVELSTRPLERTRLGKLRRHALTEAYEAARSGDEDAAGGRKPGPVSTDSLSSDDRALLDDEKARRLWDLLCRRYSDRPVEPDAHLEIDLGIDSMEWIELSVEIESGVGVTVDEKLIGKVDRVRDLLQAVGSASERLEGEAMKGPLENPGDALDDDELRWTRPRGWIRLSVATVLYGLTWAFLRSLLKIEVRGLDRLPEAPFILAPNHISYLDAPCLGVALGYRRARPFFWAGARNVLFGNWFVRGISALAQVVPVDSGRSPRSSLAFVALLLDRQRPLVWFPEGRISSDGDLLRFQPGIGLILQNRDVPVVPVRIEGTREALPPGRIRPRRGRVRIWFGEPCRAEALSEGSSGEAPKDIAEALRAKVRELPEEGNGRSDS